jgi:hypothetical protein
MLMHYRWVVLPVCATVEQTGRRFSRQEKYMLQLIDKVDADYVSNWESNLHPEDAADVRYNTLRVAYEWATSAGFGLELNSDEQTYCLTMPFGDRSVTMFEDLDVAAVVTICSYIAMDLDELRQGEKDTRQA